MKRIALLGLAVLGANSAVAQQSIKSRQLGTIQATTKELLGSATLARALPNGSVIVNDNIRRRLLLLDPTLENITVIADSTSGATNGYGQRPGALIPYVADSTLYLDMTSNSFLVIDPTGKVVRVMSPPRSADNAFIANTQGGFPGFDAKGRMIYRARYATVPTQGRDGSFQMPQQPDTAPLVRVDLDTRRADTVAALKLSRTIMNSVTMPNGGTMMMGVQAPLQTIDDWALLSDGSIAIVRGRDYHIDWILADGSNKSTEKVAFDWKRLTDEDKLAIIDSIAKVRANPASAAGAPGGPNVQMGMAGGGGRGGDGGGQRTVITQDIVAAGGGGGMPVMVGGPGGPGGMTLPSAPLPVASDLPDYMPPFTASSARPDADANLWIRTTTSGMVPANVVYDVINNKGVLVDRVEIPRSMTIVGFGKGGIVYLTQREPTGVKLLKASIR